MPDYITTYTGIRFYPASPDAEGICIEDIAHALSLLCRGNGHVSRFWSVAEHCILCAREAAAREWPARLVLACLLHDASECYLSDVPRCMTPASAISRMSLAPSRRNCPDTGSMRAAC